MHKRPLLVLFFFQAEDGIRDIGVTGVQTCALPISGIVGMEAAILAGVLQVGSFAPYINLANLGNILSQTFACGERVLSLMEEKPAVEDGENAQEIAMGNLVVKNLQFEYRKIGRAHV